MMIVMKMIGDYMNDYDDENNKVDDDDDNK